MGTSIAQHISKPLSPLLLLTTCLSLMVNAVFAAQNPITIENARPGTDQWRLTRSASDTGQQIKGYASATSVNKDQTISFYVSVNVPQTYTIEVYRMGWYGGAGGRLMQSIGPLSGVTQAPAIQNADTGLVRYPWAVSYALNVPSDWTSGIYLAKLISAEGFDNYIVFTVRDDERDADFLFQQPVNTYQAYNAYPGGDLGKSLYDSNSSAGLTTNGTRRALQVSYDRPYSGQGAGAFFQWEYFLVRWLERTGYDVTYATNIDVHRQRADLLQRHKGFFSTGHDEYWSSAMYDAAEQARDNGVNLAFFGSNAAYWQIHLAAGATGAPDRTIVCYKNATLDPETDTNLKTVRWRDIGRAEQALVGVQYIAYNNAEFNTGYVFENSDNWIYEGSGASIDGSVSGIVGYEVDTLFSNFPQPVSQNYTILSASPFTSIQGVNVVANSSIYQAPSGAWVFASGTMSWSWALDKPGFVDSRIQASTTNILQRFAAVIDANFNAGVEEFDYRDDAFRRTNKPDYARGTYLSSAGFEGGALQISLGGRNNRDIYNMSGGARKSFSLDQPRSLKLSFRYRLTQSSEYEHDEFSDVMVKVGGHRYGQPGAAYVARVVGDGNGGDAISTDWQKFSVDLGTLEAGKHSLTIGGYNNKKTLSNETTDILIDDVLLVATD